MSKDNKETAPELVIQRQFNKSIVTSIGKTKVTLTKESFTINL